MSSRQKFKLINGIRNAVSHCITDLRPNQIYKVHRIHEQIRYGMLQLQAFVDGRPNEMWRINIGKDYNEAFDDAMLFEINSGKRGCSLTYRGTRGNGRKFLYVVDVDSSDDEAEDEDVEH